MAKIQQQVSPSTYDFRKIYKNWAEKEICARVS